jgi:crotonobetainyl-CoA:carnitine CoA-transferase CaiB-like acyl-CoA transferase
MTPAAILEALWRDAGADPAALAHARLLGDDPVLPGPFRVTASALASIGASGLAAAELYRLRAGHAQTVSVDARHAAAAFRSQRYLRVNDHTAGDVWAPVSGFYQAGDGRWLQLHCNFPHHRAGVLRLLGCENARPAVAAAIKGWKAAELEETLARAGMCAAMVRSREDWLRHPQASAVAAEPLVTIQRIGEAPPEPAGRGARPLEGVRVLDLTRVIAGPVCGRTLAEHGAEVLLISASHLPSIEPLLPDMGRGKRAAFLDLRAPDDAVRLRELTREADVFVEAYRPGAVAARGFAPEDVAHLRPGIVFVTLSAYGVTGPWGSRRGFDSLVQCASGVAHEGGVVAGIEGPKHLPAQALDFATGYLAAFGAMLALARRAREGGSWLVRLSLARTGRWLDSLGRVEGGGNVPDQTPDDVRDLMEER